MNDQKNLLMAFALSTAVLLAYFAFFAPEVPSPTDQQGDLSDRAQDISALPDDGDPLTALAPSGTPATQDTASPASAPRTPVFTAQAQGSLSARGLRLDDLLLPAYRETVAPSSDPIRLLEAQGGLNPYYVDFGWTSEDTRTITPGPQALWQATAGTSLEAGKAVTWQWSAQPGITYQTRITVDEDFLFTVELSVINTTDRPIQVTPYGRVVRYRTPETLGYFILHEGPYGVFDDTLSEYNYEDLADEGPIRHTTTGGWLGFTDKYWLVALAADRAQSAKTQFVHRPDDTYQDRYLALMQTRESLRVAPGTSGQATMHVFAGAKQVALVNSYAEQITGFDRAIDFGWFFFLTKPFFYALDKINDLVGNFGVSILIFTVLIKLVMFPLANKSYRSMSKMKLLQPQIAALREQCGDDRAKLNQEMMALYKREKANPVAGCLPIAIQIPVFFALYKVLFVTIEMRHAPFFGWIQDLSAPDPTSLFTAFGLIPWTPPQFLMIGIWPILMGVTMYAQQKLNPAPTDPIQQKIFSFLPFFFTFLLASFPAGLVIYWTWNNLLSIAQQAVIMRQAGALNLSKAPSPMPAAPKLSDQKPVATSSKKTKSEKKKEKKKGRKKDKKSSPKT